MFKMIDDVLDRITMYRLLLYYLIGLLVVAVGLSVVKDLQYSPITIVASTLILVATCWVVNRLLAYIFAAPVNGESSLITGLILALIITPKFGIYDILFLLAAAGLAMGSKYVLTINRRHIFNPAAIAVALTALGPRQAASWWIGSAVLLPFVVIGGLLLVRKLRRGQMVLSFLLAVFVATIIYTLIGHGNVVTALKEAALSSPVFFLGFIMLTEPLTSPPTKKKQAWYAVLVGALLPPQVHLLNLYSSPELALIIGNIFSYIISPKTKLFPVLKEKVRIAADAVEFVFTPGQKLAYQPGQYMEWTLPHLDTDKRGSRRYFTLASSPTEPNIRLGVKFYKQSSSYKKALLAMDSDTPIVAAQIAGDFTLPKDPNQKLAFIAGGIGVTPFRSMVKYLLDTGDNRSVSMLYSARNAQDVAYKELLEEARQKIEIRTTYALTDTGTNLPDSYSIAGFITKQTIEEQIPDCLERTFYISGTHSMVTSMQDILVGLGVSKGHIKVDYFPGYA